MNEENIFLKQIGERLPANFDDLTMQEQIKINCDVYKEFDNRLSKWNGDDVAELRDLREALDIFREIVMSTLMYLNGYEHNEETELWERAKE